MTGLGWTAAATLTYGARGPEQRALRAIRANALTRRSARAWCIPLAAFGVEAVSVA